MGGRHKDNYENVCGANVSDGGLCGQIETKNTGGSLGSPAGKEILGTDVKGVCSLFIQLCRRSPMTF